MGCDIHSYVEVKIDGKWQEQKVDFPAEWSRDDKTTNEPFDWRAYGMFGFLADVRNYSKIPPLDSPRGWPDDLSEKLRKDVLEEDWDYHSHSYFTIKELQDFNYDQTFEDRRCTKQVRPNVFDGAALADIGQGEVKTFREFLGEDFFRDIGIMAGSAVNPEDVRVLFAFDN